MWDGTTWVTVPGSLSFGWTKSILAFDDGTGPRLHWGTHGGTDLPVYACTSQWDGSQWTYAQCLVPYANPAYALASIDMGPPLGQRLFSVTGSGIIMSQPTGNWTSIPGSPYNVDYSSVDFQGTILTHHTRGGNVPVVVALDSSRGRLVRYAGCPRCDGDRNLDGSTDAADLFDFLDEWFSLPTRSVQQLFNFLTDWFASCT